MALTLQAQLQQEVNKLGTRLTNALANCNNGQAATSVEDWRYALLRMNKLRENVQRTLNSLRLMQGDFLKLIVLLLLI